MAKRKDQNKKSNPSDDRHKSEHTLFVGSKKALYGGILAAAIALGGHGWSGRFITVTRHGSYWNRLRLRRIIWAVRLLQPRQRFSL